MAGAEPAAVDEMWKRLQSHAGVVGVLIVNGDGIGIRSTFDAPATVALAALVSQFTVKARGAVKALSGDDDELRTLRVRSRSNELISERRRQRRWRGRRAGACWRAGVQGAPAPARRAPVPAARAAAATTAHAPTPAQSAPTLTRPAASTTSSWCRRPPQRRDARARRCTLAALVARRPAARPLLRSPPLLIAACCAPADACTRPLGLVQRA